MKKINIYSDDTEEEKKNFIISTFIWGDSISCRDYENSIKNIVEYYKKINILQKNFKGFHALRLNYSNWNKMSKPYCEVLSKLHFYIKNSCLFSLIYLESKKKYEANSKLIEDSLRDHLLNRKSHLGEIYQHINEQDLKVLYKSSHKMYHYFLHREKFGGPNTSFKYYPDASGKILDYKNRKFFIGIPGKGDIYEDFTKILTLLANGLANTMNKSKILNQLGWNPRPNNQRLDIFDPMKDEDSFLIQANDIISNFFLNLIRYEAGNKSKTVELKAKELLKLNIFNNILNKIRDNFKLLNGKCICTNDELKVSVRIESEDKVPPRIIFR